MKAMILSAGCGGRLGPLAKELPKPLLPIKGKPIIIYHLERLAKANITEVVMNLYYKAEMIQQRLGDGRTFGVCLHYSFEEQLLNTGGGIYQTLPYFKQQPFVVISCDVWSDFAFENFSLPKGMLAHLLMVDNPESHPQGDFALDNGMISEVGSKKLTYAGIAVLDPKLFQDCAAGRFPLIKPLVTAIQAGKVSGEHFTGKWVNINTMDELNSVAVV